MKGGTKTVLIMKATSVEGVSEIKLIRTDTTLDLSREAEKVCRLLRVDAVYLDVDLVGIVHGHTEPAKGKAPITEIVDTSSLSLAYAYGTGSFDSLVHNSTSNQFCLQSKSLRKVRCKSLSNRNTTRSKQSKPSEANNKKKKPKK
jgi:hypothetical protein